MTQYRMLIVYSPKEKTIDIEKIRQHMESAGFDVTNITPNPPLGPKCNIEIYYESDIPFPPPFAKNMINEQKLDTEVGFLQQVQKEGSWVNVYKTTICEAEDCNQPAEQSVIRFKKEGERRIYGVCKHHAELANKGEFVPKT